MRYGRGGLAKNDHVAILSLNSNLYLESLFGIPYMGARMVPLNIRWAIPELEHSVTDAQCKVLLFDKAFTLAVEALRSQNTPLETFLYMGSVEECPAWAHHLESLLEQAQLCVEAMVGDEEIAGIFYTGGTTGFPKGVILTHTALFSSAISLVAALPLKSDASFG